MIVYGDILIAVNTLTNFLILLLGAKLCSYPAKPWRCLLGGLGGGVYALIAVIAPAGGILWQSASFVLMCMISYGPRKSALRPSVLAFLMAAALAGFVHLAVQVFSVDALYVNGGVYFPIGAKILILLAGCFYLAAAVLASGSLRHGKKEIRKISLCLPDGEWEVSALYDTGNTVKDPFGGLPVIVVNECVISEVLQFPEMARILQNPTEGVSVLQEKFPQLHIRLIPYKAVGISCGLLMAFPCKVRVEHAKKTRKVLVALSPTEVSDGGTYEALIGGELF